MSIAILAVAQIRRMSYFALARYRFPRRSQTQCESCKRDEEFGCSIGSDCSGRLFGAANGGASSRSQRSLFLSSVLNRARCGRCSSKWTSNRPVGVPPGGSTCPFFATQAKRQAWRVTMHRSRGLDRDGLRQGRRLYIYMYFQLMPRPHAALLLFLSTRAPLLDLHSFTRQR